jgi:type II secretory pathway component PulC
VNSFRSKRSYGTKVGRIVAVLLVVLLCSGCSLLWKRSSLQGDPVPKPAARGITEIKIEIPKERYSQYLQRGESLNRVRLVPVYSRGGSSGEFRIFDVKQGSVFELLGIENLDIVVAANGFVIPGGNVFWQYLVMMSDMPEGSIEIRRNGIPFLMKYKFS